ncbi:hypothetical protein MMIC_P0042 [Mariprofundus micogutta]|uniref:CN hydrolase domain-containing protein n=1 Tax=Mariprofundus micogutta TaxID=1921010 RepID=A0A1L8CJM6_9PROT|nr:hypothetical protein MMIC_P0042 [Mariprofundus micogutta]
MIINPWGEVVDELAEGQGFVVADLSMAELNRVRESMPVLRHKKL